MGIDWSQRPVAIVTGGASGIGAASARALARRGAHVVVIDVDDVRGAAVAAEIGGTFLALDVASAADWARAVSRIEAETGAITIAHLNAGVMTHPPSTDPVTTSDLAGVTESAYRRILGVNVDGVVLGLRALLPAMSGRRFGRIVATASIGGLTPVPFDPLYSMTKHAIVGLVRSVAPGLAGRGITLAALCPGGVRTPLMPHFVRDLDLPLLAPEEVASAVVMLVEEAPEGDVFVIQPGAPAPHALPPPSITLG
jgi:NAD(P)-dependent dehydrogenase (short-subunit alcohol dehydrogenase family)